MGGVIGVDPGQDGSICVLRDGDVVGWTKMPVRKSGKVDDLAIEKWMLEIDVRDFALFVEEQRLVPNQSYRGNFTIVENVARVIVAAERALVATVSHVPPQTWQSTILSGVPQTGLHDKPTKDRSIWYAINAGYEHMIKRPRGSYHDGMADAFCIARYGHLFSV